MTPATRALDKAGIDYRLHRYDHDPKAQSYGSEAAEMLGLDPARVFKTLLVTSESGELLVAVVPVIGMLDLKALATAQHRLPAGRHQSAGTEKSTADVYRQ
jgi:Cys-tRNA(Pro)/Cys-tRNA(Cys) deacylase